MVPSNFGVESTRKWKEHGNSNHGFLNTWNILRKKRGVDCAGKHERVLCMENAAQGGI